MYRVQTDFAFAKDIKGKEAQRIQSREIQKSAGVQSSRKTNYFPVENRDGIWANSNLAKTIPNSEHETVEFFTESPSKILISPEYWGGGLKDRDWVKIHHQNSWISLRFPTANFVQNMGATWRDENRVPKLGINFRFYRARPWQFVSPEAFAPDLPATRGPLLCKIFNFLFLASFRSIFPVFRLNSSWFYSYFVTA